MLASVALAESAEHACVELHAFRIFIRLAEIAGRLWKRVISQALGRFTKHRRSVRLFHRRRWILAGARILEWIAARDLFSFDVSRFAAGAHQVLETIEVRFQLRRVNTPVLDRDVRRDEILAIALGHPSTHAQIGILEAISLS